MRSARSGRRGTTRSSFFTDSRATRPGSRFEPAAHPRPGHAVRDSVGYADHVAGDSPWAVTLPVMAVGAGAIVIEKHITDDRAPQGHRLLLVGGAGGARPSRAALRDAARALGNTDYEMSDDELTYMHQVKKSRRRGGRSGARAPADRRQRDVTSARRRTRIR